jgi:hypothetical protein
MPANHQGNVKVLRTYSLKPEFFSGGVLIDILCFSYARRRLPEVNHITVACLTGQLVLAPLLLRWVYIHVADGPGIRYPFGVRWGVARSFFKNKINAMYVNQLLYHVPVALIIDALEEVPSL